MEPLIVAVFSALKMQWIKFRLWKPFIQATEKPNEVQQKLLLQIIQNNTQTKFGKDHRFETISNYEDYRKHVPIMSYEALQPYIELQELEKKPHLCSEQPVMYAQTSGSSSAAKLIPINRQTISQYRLSQHLVAYAIYSSIPGAYKGKILAIVSPAVEGYMDSGTPYGSMSGLIYNSMPALTRSKYVLPASVFEIEDYDQKYYNIALHALMEPNITMIATANPSTLVKLEQVINDQVTLLITDVAKQDTEQAKKLQKLLSTNGKLIFADLWPNLKVITTWTGGSCGAQLPNLSNKIPAHTQIVELGYLSSEFRGGITVDTQTNTQIPAIHENFYEFVEKNDWEQGIRDFKTLNQVTTDKQYYIFTTTQAGLYRYDINDIIEVTGWFNNTPAIRFIQKGKGIINLTGEKLYESQVVKAILKVLEGNNTKVPFFIMLGSSEKLTYTLYIESGNIDPQHLEQELNRQNMEFKAKLASGRLQPIKIVRVKPNTGDVYKQHCIKKGQREGQFKVNHLQYTHNCSFNFDHYEEEMIDENH